MLQIRVGIQLASLGQPFKQALQTARRLGAEAVEIDARGDLKPQELSQSAIRAVRKQLEDLELKVCAVSIRTRRGYNVMQDLEPRIEATRQAMQFAFDLGASVVINQVGRVPEKSEGPEWDLLVQVLSDLGRHGQKVGALLAAETGSESGADLARLLAALPERLIGVNFDPGNLVVNGFSAIDAARLLGSSILHVHAKDGVRDLAQGRGVEVPLGRGSVDFPEILAVLEERQYRGYLTVERENATHPELEIGQAIQYLRNL